MALARRTEGHLAAPLQLAGRTKHLGDALTVPTQPFADSQSAAWAGFTHFLHLRFTEGKKKKLQCSSWPCPRAQLHFFQNHNCNARHSNKQRTRREGALRPRTVTAFCWRTPASRACAGARHSSQSAVPLKSVCSQHRRHSSAGRVT